jgi:hypothetical protein
MMFHASLALLALSPLASSQTIWTVDAAGPSDFDDIQSAVDAASDGDLILVDGNADTSFYPGFVIDGKSLVLQGRGEPTIRAANLFGVNQGQSLTIRNLSAVQTLSLRGMEFDQLGSYEERVATFTDCAGAIVLEDCAFTSSGRMVEVVRSSSVTLTRCSLLAPQSRLVELPQSASIPFSYTALTGVESGLWFYDSEIRGGDGLPAGSLFGQVGESVGAGDGLGLLDSSVFASGSVFAGGVSLDAVACASGADGGNGLSASGASTSLRLLDSTTIGGGGGAGGCGQPDGVDGEDLVAPAGTVTLRPGWPDPARSLHRRPAEARSSCSSTERRETWWSWSTRWRGRGRSRLRA